MSLFDPALDREAFEVEGKHYTVTATDVAKMAGRERRWVTFNARKLGGIRKVWPGREEWGTAVWHFPEEDIDQLLYALIGGRPPGGTKT
jgi:hypothetical protein